MPPSKLPGVGTTIFTVMSQLAADQGAIDLSQGYPDFAVPAPLLARVEHHLRAGHNQYAPMAGLPALREAIAEKTAALYGVECDPGEQITITSGATEALFAAIHAFVHPGDEVILLDPAYDAYDPAVRLAGGRPVHLPLSGPGFDLDLDRLAAAIGPRSRMLVLNTPHNPTGAVLPASRIEALARLLRDSDLLVVSDEVYEHMVFDGEEHASLLRYPALFERSLVISSFGKTCHATGWKIGYVVAPRPLSAEFRRVHQFVQFCVATPLQHALADYLRSDPQHYRELPAFYQRKRDLFCQLLAGSRFRLTPSAGTYFQLADYSAISDEPDVDFARRLTRDAGVAAIPVSVFYAAPPADQRLLRFCFAKADETLRAAAERLEAL
ncbi:MAG: pyridoxal phosphate-dependent aminotransferase [Gammaproteobacteria bacterium]|nr:MAG: pyridoxal phosphate-dependent aminotransferase [Gammaproteobacteria bacterium]